MFTACQVNNALWLFVSWAKILLSAKAKNKWVLSIHFALIYLTHEAELNLRDLQTSPRVLPATRLRDWRPVLLQWAIWCEAATWAVIIFLLPLVPLTGFPSFPVASLCKAGLDALHKLQRNQWVTWSLKSSFDTFRMIARAILCNTSSDTSVWWELQNLASSSNFKRLKILSEVKEY